MQQTSLGERVRIPKAAAVVASNLRRGIVRGEYVPGDALPNETELMELYGVSRPVVREALRILESESLIEIKRGARGGARFTKPDIAVAARHTALLLQLEGTTLEDLFEARATLEPAAVRKLALQPSPEVVARLRASLEEGAELVGDPVAYPIHAAQFHEELIELAGNKTVAVLGRLLLQIVETHNRATFERIPADQVKDVGAAASICHGEVIDLIEAGDADRAEQMWRDHLESATSTALGRLGPTTVVDLLDGSF